MRSSTRPRPISLRRRLKQRAQNQWSAIFDGHPRPRCRTSRTARPTHPVGRALVQTLTPESADGVSLMSLRNVFFDVDTKVSNDTASVVSYTPVERDGGFHGSHLVIKLTTSKGEVMVNQIALLDQATSEGVRDRSEVLDRVLRRRTRRRSSR